MPYYMWFEWIKLKVNPFDESYTVTRFQHDSHALSFLERFGPGQNPVHILPQCGHCAAFLYCLKQPEKEIHKEKRIKQNTNSLQY